MVRVLNFESCTFYFRSILVRTTVDSFNLFDVSFFCRIWIIMSVSLLHHRFVMELKGDSEHYVKRLADLKKTI